MANQNLAGAFLLGMKAYLNLDVVLEVLLSRSSFLLYVVNYDMICIGALIKLEGGLVS
jgi:hypothetical protein